MAEVVAVFQTYGLTPEESAPVARALQARPAAWVDFMMRFELGLEAPEPKRALTSALTIAGAYIAGGVIPLGPYMAVANARTALVVSVVVTLVALSIFGYIKGHFTGAAPVRSAVQTLSDWRARGGRGVPDRPPGLVMVKEYAGDERGVVGSGW